MAQGCELLTEREKQTLRLLLAGHDAKSIARHFGLSVHTVNERLRDARRKLAVSSSREAARRLRAAEGAGPETVGDMPFGGAAPPPADHADPRPGAARRRWRAGWAVGGLAMSLLLATLFVLSAPQATPTQAAALPETDASRAARGWLALVDAAKWRESWAAAGRSFRAVNSVERWRQASERARVPLGGVVSRTLVGDDDTPSPPHGYQVVRFRTAFATRTATETLSLDRERSGWRVVGIYIE